MKIEIEVESMGKIHNNIRALEHAIERKDLSSADMTALMDSLSIFEGLRKAHPFLRGD